MEANKGELNGVEKDFHWGGDAFLLSLQKASGKSVELQCRGWKQNSLNL